MSKRRGHGGGSIQQRGESSYRLRYYVGDIRHTVTFRGTKKEADVELRRLMSDADKGIHIAPAKLTLKQWADQWIELKAAERQHKTVARYEDLLRLHVMPKLGDRFLQKITAHEINLLYAQITTLAPRTRHHVATVLKSCLQAAADSKLIASNPAGKRPSPGDAEAGQALDQDQLAVLVEGFRGSTMFELVCVLAFTGMRRGEALGLRWSDFDAANKTLKVDRALEYTQKFGLRFKSPKSERGKRSIVLDDFLVELLTKERSRPSAWRLADLPGPRRSVRIAPPSRQRHQAIHKSRCKDPRLPDQAARPPGDARNVAAGSGNRCPHGRQKAGP